MPVWGLIADVHGNLPALEQAIALLRRAGVERFAFLGDYLGRGNSAGCARLIQSVASVALAGNRDYDWQDRVEPAVRAWVASLPRVWAGDGLLLAHGDARLTRALSTAQIGREFADAWREMERCGARLLAFGHSHHARAWRLAADAAVEPLALGDDEMRLQPGYRYVLNVGTTGLPFPRKGGPSVALVDTSRATFRVLPLQRR